MDLVRSDGLDDRACSLAGVQLVDAVADVRADRATDTVGPPATSSPVMPAASRSKTSRSRLVTRSFGPSTTAPSRALIAGSAYGSPLATVRTASTNCLMPPGSSTTPPAPLSRPPARVATSSLPV
jgi:hypothetical protein